MISKIKLSNYILIEMSEESRNNLINRYEKLFQSFNSNAEDKSYILNNIDNYKILLNVTVFVSAMQFIQSNKMADLDYCRKEITAKFAENSGNSFKAFKALHSKYVDKLSALCNIDDKSLFKTCIDIESVEQALNTFDLETVSVDDIPDTEFDMQGDFGDLDDVMSELFPDEVDDEPEGGWDDTEEFDMSDFTEDIDTSEGDFEDTDSDFDTKLDNSEEENNNKDDIELFKQVYGLYDEDANTPLKAAVDGIVQSFRELYSSCYSGITNPDGILTNKGLLSLDKTIDGKFVFKYNHADQEKEKVDFLRNKGKYTQYYQAVMYAMGVANGANKLYNGMSLDDRRQCIEDAIKIGENIFGTAIDGRQDRTPKWKDVKDVVQQYPRFHSEIMTGNFTLSSDMEKWANDSSNKIRHSKVKITNIEDVLKWAKKRVSDALTSACIDCGIKVEDVGENDVEVKSICERMAKSIKNIIAITNNKKGFMTVSICNSEAVNINKFTEDIKEYFNSSSAGSNSVQIVVKNNGSESGVIELDIITSISDYDKSSSFSADVIDNIIETGVVPSWSNAVLGEKDEGGTLTFDFTKSCSVAIYGSSGSGKGIMTSALLTNAMADGCEIFYFDGKPDNGAALAKIAWDSGTGDAAVFNGCTGGSDTFQTYLENYSHGIRDVALRNSSLDNIPSLDDNEDWPFNDPTSRKQLAEISLTLKAFDFVHDMVLLRTSDSNVEILPNGKKRWAVFVIDEIQDAAKTEKIVRNLMNNYMEKVGETEVYDDETKTDSKGNVTKQQKRNGKIKDSKNWHRDTGYLFCKKWLAWADSRCVQWDNVVTKSLRNSSSTLITIFQSNQWLSQKANEAGNTKIGRLMLTVAQKTTKIVGRGALVSSNQWGDDTDYPWVSETDKGKWVIANGESGLSATSKVFKPFKVFTTDLGAGVVVPPEDIGAGSMDCSMSKADNKKKPLGLQSYTKYLFSGLSTEIQEQLAEGKRAESTLTPEGVLTSSFIYMDNIIRNHKDPNGLLHYMYSIPVIENFNGKASDQEIQAIEQLDNGDTSQGLLESLNSDLNSNNEVYKSEDPIINTIPINETKLNTDMRFMSTKQLISANYDDNTLSNYMNKHIYNRLSYNKVENLDYKNVNNSVGGLLTMTILAGTLHYVSSRGLYNIQKFRAEAEKYIYSGMDNSHAYKVLLGLLDCYDQGIVDYDKKVTSDRIKVFILKYFNTVNTNNTESQGFDTQGYESNIDFGTSETVVFGNEEESGAMNINGQSPILNSQSIPEDSMPIPGIHRVNDQGEMIVDNPRSTTEIITRDASTYVEVPLSQYGFAKKMQKKFFESKNGIAYEFKLRWDFILGIIGKTFPDSSRVHTLVLRDNSIRVNPSNDYPGTEVIANGTLGGDYNIQLSDIVSFKDTFKKLPMLRKIEIDSSIIPCAIREYGEEAQITMFEKHRNLLVIVMGDQTYNRNTLEQQKQQMKEQMSVEKTKMAIEATCASKNPRLNKKSPGYVSKVFDFGHNVTGSVTSGGWGATKNFARKAKESATRKNPSIGGMLGWSLGATALLGFTAIFAIPHGIGSAIKGISDSFKG